MAPRICIAAAALFASFAAAAGGADQGGPAAVETGLEGFVHPLRAEAGHVISPALSPLPRSEVHAGVGFAFAREERGRAEYLDLQAALLVGGAWSPERLPDLGLGADLVALRTTFLHAKVPPAIDEWRRFADLGMLGLHARYVTWRRTGGGAGPEIALTPFVRLGLPTDTSRLRPHRRMPVRRVIDPLVFEAPYVLVEPGASMAVVFGPVSFFAHQAPVFAPVAGETFHFFWSSHLGAGIRLWRRLEIALESTGLLRATRDDRGERLAAFTVDPGLRLVLGDWAAEISTRIGTSDDARHSHGELSAFVGLAWTPSPR